jgi:hypothetical protein
MTMSASDSKKAAFAALAFRTASDGSLTDDVRTEIGATIGGPTWPPTAGSGLLEVQHLLHEQGYEFFEDYTITRNTTTYPTTIGPNASAHMCVIIYLAIIDPGSMYSTHQTVRDGLWNQLTTYNQSTLKTRLGLWGHTVAANFTIS